VTPAYDGQCEECGYVYETVSPGDAIVAIRSYARRYRAPLTRGLPDEDLDDVVRRKPAPDVWSALEYACHVRDVFAVQKSRIERMLVEDRPVFEPMRRDDTAVVLKYNEQDRDAVADAIAANAEALASTLETISPDDWTRTAIYPFPQPTERTLLWLTRHTVHEGTHHLLDIGRVLRMVRGR
jgi:S-DNA-T family DNA segregation ATPase FtsK/SpoIIIE